MKKFSILFSFAAALILAGCGKEAGTPESSGDGIVLRMSCAGHATRSTAGVGDENRIVSVDILLYDDVSSAPFVVKRVDVASESQLAGTFEHTFSFSSDFGSDVSKLKRTTAFVIANFNSSGELDGKTLAQVKALTVDASVSGFVDKSGAKVEKSPKTGEDVLSGCKVASAPIFVMTSQGQFSEGTGADDGKIVADLTLKRLAAKVELSMKFPDAEITTTGNDVTYGPVTTTWEPMLGGEDVRVYLQNATLEAAIGGADDTPVYPLIFQYITYAQTFVAEDFVSGDPWKGRTFTSSPFYTHPWEWKEGDDEPFIKLILPWRFQTTAEIDGHSVVVNSDVVELYYKVMLPTSVTALVANTWYKPLVNLDVLGGEAETPTIIIIPDPGMEILDWGEVGGDQIGTIALTEAIFLEPSSENVEVGRGAKASIKVSSSGPVNMNIKNIYYDLLVNVDDPQSLSEVGSKSLPNSSPYNVAPYTDATEQGHARLYIIKDGVVQTDNLKSGWAPAGWLSLDAGLAGEGGVGHLNLNHALTVDPSDVDFAITPYTYEVELSLADHTDVTKTVTITQDPLIGVSSEISKGWAYVAGTSNRTWEATNNVRVELANSVYTTLISKGTRTNSNGTTGVSGAFRNLGYLAPVDLRNSAALNKTKFRFKFDVSPFSSTSHVADVRSDLRNHSHSVEISEGVTFTDNTHWVFDHYSSNASQTLSASNYTNYSEGSPFGDSESAPENYEEIVNNYLGSTESKNLIAPSFVVASSYGGIAGNMTYGMAVLRCATYQEDGYPAGRWRIPTEAELEYMSKIQSLGLIPNVLTGNCWASSGRYFSSSSSSFIESDSSNPSVRCVYDTWYWGSDEVAAAKDGDGYKWYVSPVK